MFDPIKASVKIKGEFVDYLSTDFRFRDQNLQSQFKDQLDKTISKGPYLEINDVFKTSRSISELIDDGVLSPLFYEIEKDKEEKDRTLPLYRKLYVHQEKAIRQIVDGNNVVISTGTGSGKTNCFLIPVINDLLREIETKDELTPGVRAIFIFPMNALANDQIKNIRHLLMDYPQITFGVYNGDTEEDDRDAAQLYKKMFMDDPIKKLREPLPNELISRRQMKETPPNILFTNYAMLEYLLFRPGDDVIFSQSDFKYIVLDEAHVYSGATGIETSMLLRRLKARIKKTKNPQFILTSATLGGTDEEIVEFAKKISGEDFSTSNIVRGEREKQEFDQNNLKKYSSELFKDLADETKTIRDVLDIYNIAYDHYEDDDDILYDLLISSELYYKLRGGVDKIYLTDVDKRRGILTDVSKIVKSSGVFTLKEIKNRLDVDDDTLVAFISLCTKAKKGKKALLDARYHYFIRTLEGCYITLPINGETKLSLTTSETLEGTQRRMFEVAICDDCGAAALVGRIEEGHLRNTKKYQESPDYFFIADQFNEDIEDDDDDEAELEEALKKKTAKKPLKDFYLCPQCGMISEGRDHIDCDCQVEHIHLLKANKTISGNVKCCNCHTGIHKRVYIGNDGATSTLATSLFEALPKTITKVSEKDDTNNPFLSKSSTTKVEQVESQGQFLAFSDSRQDAAKFAWYFGESYKEFLRRRGICHLVEEDQKKGDFAPKSISNYVSRLKNYFDNTGCFEDKSYEAPETNNNRNAWVAMLNELGRNASGNSLTSLGYLQFRYKGNDSLPQETISYFAKTYGVTNKDVEDLLNLLFLEIVKTGAIKTDNDTDIGDDDRKYVFYSEKQRYISEQRIPNSHNISHWLPRQKTDDSYYRTNKIYYVKQALNLADDQEGDKKAYNFLKQYWDYLIDPQNEYRLILDTKAGAYYLPAKNINVYVAGNSQLKWYSCSKCGKIQNFLSDGKCSVPKCHHDVDEIQPEVLRNDNHFAKLYEVKDMYPLISKEHTAQLNKKESLRYQEDFLKKKINVLSCSTTFEMGVDIGDLEAVFLRDIPPSPSNYNQRAGRAGRSIDSAAYVLTFAKLSSHDMYFYEDPELMINGEIMAPSFKLENDKIAKRHLYATVLSTFLREKPWIYNHNNADKFLNDTDDVTGKKGYEIFFDWLNKKTANNDEELKNELKASLPADNGFHETLGLDNYSWVDDFIGSDGVLSNLIETYNDNIKEFNDVIKETNENPDLDEAEKTRRVDNYVHSRERYKRNEFIDFLAKGNILPRYGFPVNTVELQQNETTTTGSKLNLSRDLQLAISDYAPSSQVIANGLMYTSRYIKKSVNDKYFGWRKAYIATCSHRDCKATNYSVTPVNKPVKCISCGRPIDPMFFKESIEPVAGFITEKDPQPIPMNSQERYYSAPIYYIGDPDAKKIDKTEINFGSIKVSIESTSNDALLVQSRNQFLVCEQCGYAIAIDDIYSDIKEQKGLIPDTHVNTHGYPCHCSNFHRYYLHHTFKTDVAKISFSGVSTGDWQTILSVGYAIYNATLSVLHIDSKDLSITLKGNFNALYDMVDYSIVIFDRIAGGSGYSRKLTGHNGGTFRKIVQVAYDNMAKCDCDPSCYKCLRSYENRNYHDDLDRKKAMAFLEQLIDLN